ncbi:MAG: hypothetical protein ACK5HU_03975 [Flavobacteriales bacterium]
MKKSILTVVLTVLFIACSTPKAATNSESSETITPKDETTTKLSFYKDVLFQNLTLRVEGQYLPLTSVTFTHTKSDLVGKKRIYELYGDWVKAISLSTSKHPLLLWKNIPLLDNDFKMTTIIVDGKLVNNVNEISFYVYDTKTKEDLLAKNSSYRKQILDKIILLLETNNPENKSFEKKFWKDFYFVDIYEGN